LRAAGIPVIDLESAKRHAIHRRYDEMRQIIARQPILQVRRQQKRLVAITRNKISHDLRLHCFVVQSDRLLARPHQDPPPKAKAVSGRWIERASAFSRAGPDAVRAAQCAALPPPFRQRVRRGLAQLRGAPCRQTTSLAAKAEMCSGFWPWIRAPPSMSRPSKRRSSPNPMAGRAVIGAVTIAFKKSPSLSTP